VNWRKGGKMIIGPIADSECPCCDTTIKNATVFLYARAAGFIDLFTLRMKREGR
jgi:hypothetical protein